jgi:ferredoxin
VNMCKNKITGKGTCTACKCRGISSPKVYDHEEEQKLLFLDKNQGSSQVKPQPRSIRKGD